MNVAAAAMAFERVRADPGVDTRHNGSRPGNIPDDGFWRFARGGARDYDGSCFMTLGHQKGDADMSKLKRDPLIEGLCLIVTIAGCRAATIYQVIREARKTNPKTKLFAS